MRSRPALLLLVFAAAAPAQAAAQAGPAGHVSLLADYLPNRADTAELRARIFAEQTLEPSPRVTLTLSGFVEGLLARRPVMPLPSRVLDADVRRDAVARVQDANIELRAGRADLLAGFARVAWGKLDELQPTDVVNPLDVSRFFLEGRSEARLPVALVRGRVFLSEHAVLEGIYVLAFRRGRFDQLEEDTSPFNLVRSFPLPPGVPVQPEVVGREPAFGEAQGGARFSATAGRVDWSVSAYRGFEPFGLFSAASLDVRRSHPRFTMIGGDFETVRGEWGVRGEVAAFVEDSFQSPLPAIVGGSSFEAGLGADRRAGEYRVSGTVLLHREQYDVPLDPRVSQDTGRTDVSLVAAADRSFARERYRLRAFGVYNASESSGFLRGITTATLRDNLALEGSIGWFIGRGDDLVGRFGDSDFGYVRLKYYF